MKKYVILLALSAAVLTGCNSNKESLSAEEISWEAFCKARGYNSQAEDEKAVNEYLDTWVGSYEEEGVFNNLPAE